MLRAGGKINVGPLYRLNGGFPDFGPVGRLDFAGVDGKKSFDVLCHFSDFSREPPGLHGFAAANCCKLVGVSLVL